MNPEILKGLIAATPVILAPFLAWILARSGISREIARLDYVAKRLDVLDKLKKLQVSPKEGQLGSIMERELKFVDAFLERQRLYLQIELTQGDTSSRTVHGQKAATVARKSRTLTQRVLQGLAYFMFVFTALGTLGGIITVVTEGDEEWYYGAIALLFWLVVGLVLLRLSKPKLPNSGSSGSQQSPPNSS